MPREIDLTPNYQAIFQRFLADAENAGLNIQNTAHGFLDSRDLRHIQSLIAPITIAIQCATSVEEIQQFRETLAAILAHLDKTATDLERFEEETRCAAEI